MSKRIYEKRQLQVHRNIWTTKDRILAGIVLAVVALGIVSLVSWILSTEHPAIFSAVAAMVCLVAYTVVRYGTEKDDWPTYMAIWFFFDHD
jgi:cobalamin biosynthesis protein CobD/CbiB